MEIYHSIHQMLKSLHTEDECREYLEELRWGGKPVCPHCGSISEHHYKLKQKGEFKGLYKCKDCRSRFTVRIGTMFEDSNLPLSIWFYAISHFLSHKRGINSCELARDAHITQKTAWFVLHRIRHNIKDKDDDTTFDNDTQVDETYVGGKTSEKHQRRKNHKEGKKNKGRSLAQKTPVMGLLSDGKVYIQVIKDASSKVLLDVIDRIVKKGTTVISDGWAGYKNVKDNYRHEVVQHSLGIYVNEKGYHTNGIEGFWSHFKRGIVGIYYLVSPKHLPKYCKEYAFRHNTRKITDMERFNQFLQQPTERLYYGELLMQPEWIW